MLSACHFGWPTSLASFYPTGSSEKSSVHSLTITTVLGRLRQARTRVDRAASHRPPHRICGESTEQNRNKKPFSLTRRQGCVPDVHLYRRPNGTARIAFEPTCVPLGSTFTLHIIRVRQSAATRAVAPYTASRFTIRFFCAPQRYELYQCIYPPHWLLERLDGSDAWLEWLKAIDSAQHIGAGFGVNVHDRSYA